MIGAINDALWWIIVLVVIAIMVISGHGQPEPAPDERQLPVDVQIQNDFLQKSILANSSDAIVFGDYRVVKHQADLIRPTWRVERNGETMFTGPMIEAMEFAFRKSEGAERE